MSLGHRIQEQRKKVKLTQVELAKLLDKSPRTLQDYEADKIQPPIEVLNKLSKILNTDIDYLITGKKYDLPQTVPEILEDILPDILNKNLFDEKGRLLKNRMGIVNKINKSLVDSKNLTDNTTEQLASAMEVTNNSNNSLGNKINSIFKKAQKYVDDYNNKINMIIASFKLYKIKYEIVKYTDDGEIPLTIKVNKDDCYYIFDTDDLIYIYDTAKINFDNTVNSIVDIFLKQKQGG